MFESRFPEAPGGVPPCDRPYIYPQLLPAGLLRGRGEEPPPPLLKSYFGLQKRENQACIPLLEARVWRAKMPLFLGGILTCG